MTKYPNFYVIPGLIFTTPLEAVLKNTGYTENELFTSRMRVKVQARQDLFFLEYLNGETEQSIGNKYSFVASNIHHALNQVRARISIYKKDAAQMNQYAAQCNLKDEFLEEYIPLKTFK